MSSILSFKADCSASLVTVNGSEYPFNRAYIKSVVTDYRYKDRIMPIIYLILEPDDDLYNTIIDNATDGTITLRCINYDFESGTGFQKEIINDKFIYFVPTKYNYSKDI